MDHRLCKANRSLRAAIVACAALSFTVTLCLPVRLWAEAPGRGLTAPFEMTFLKDTIDHHFAALRITELAAGTDAVRDTAVAPGEGTAATPGFDATEPKSSLDEIKSMARRNNRVQREEILAAQRFLRDWYGVEYTPTIAPVNEARIDLLTEAAPGAEFDHLFLETFSRHHFTITVRAVECLTSSELTHDDLNRYCRAILEAQLVDIADMRHLLCRNANICDYQPLAGLKGVHSDDGGEIDARFKRFKKVTKDEDEDGEDHYDRGR